MQLFETIQLIQGELWERLERTTIVERYGMPEAVAGKATVLIGMRRVGKTFCLISQLQQLMREGVPRESILFLNLEDDRLGINDLSTLREGVESFFQQTPANYSRQTYIFLDEIQVIAGWEQLARRLIETDRCELWLTGSSAKMLSKEVATQFRGRSLTYEIWPYDFFEFLKASQIAWIDPAASFASRDESREQCEGYLLSGGFPETVGQYIDTRRRILTDYRSVVVLRDIIERHRVTNIVALEQLVSAVLVNSGRLLSVNKITSDFKSRGISVGKDTLYEYLMHLEDAFLAFSVPLFDESLRVRSTSPKKVFCVDTGMVAQHALRPKADLGRLFENVIFLDLRRRGYRIYYYMTQEGAEVDFVAVSGNGQRFIIQACFDTSNQTTLAREEGSLITAKKELDCEGLLVTPSLYCKSRDWLQGIS